MSQKLCAIMNHFQVIIKFDIVMILCYVLHTASFFYSVGKGTELLSNLQGMLSTPYCERGIFVETIEA